MKSLWCILLINLVLIVPYALSDAQEGKGYDDYYNEEDDTAVPDELTNNQVQNVQIEEETESSEVIEHPKVSTTHRPKHHKKSKHATTLRTTSVPLENKHYAKINPAAMLTTSVPLEKKHHPKNNLAAMLTTSVPLENNNYFKINLTAMFASMIQRTRKPKLPEFFDWADHYTLYGKKRNRYGEPDSYAEVVRAQKEKSPGGLGFGKLREDYKSKKEREPISKRKEMIRYSLDEKTKKKSFNEDIVAKYLKSKNPFEGIPKHVFDADMYKYRGLG